MLPDFRFEVTSTLYIALEILITCSVMLPWRYALCLNWYFWYLGKMMRDSIRGENANPFIDINSWHWTSSNSLCLKLIILEGYHKRNENERENCKKETLKIPFNHRHSNEIHALYYYDLNHFLCNRTPLLHLYFWWRKWKCKSWKLTFHPHSACKIYLVIIPFYLAFFY